MITVSAQTLSSAQDGEDSAVAAVLEACRPSIVSYIKKLRLNREDLNDLVQDSLLVVMNCIDRYDPEKGEFGALVNDAVHKLLSSFLQSRQRRQLSLEHCGEPHSDYVDRDVDLEDALEQLPPMQRVLVQEHFGIGERVFDYSVGGLAARHNLSSEQVQKELQEAFQFLRRSA